MQRLCDIALTEWRHPHFSTRLLFNLIPLSIQRIIRDTGIGRILADTATTIMAVLFGLACPSQIVNLVIIRKTQKVLHYGKSPSEFLKVIDIHENELKRATGGNSKVLIFVHGGAWGSGKPWMYQFTVQGLAQSVGATKAVVVGYPLYPEASIKEQVKCVISAVDYIKSNLTIVDSTLILAGHSSGANIAALACIESASAGTKFIDLFIGLCGVYDLHKHHWYEANRGVHEISPMTAAAGGYDELPTSSPTTLLSLPHVRMNLKPTNFPRCILLHGHADTTVPVSSTMEFECALQQLEIPVKAIYYQVCNCTKELQSNTMHVSFFFMLYSKL